MSQEPQNCWEFKNCTREDKHWCPAFEHQMGRDCWLVAVNEPGKGCREAGEAGMEYCVNKCDWYKKLN